MGKAHDDDQVRERARRQSRAGLPRATHFRKPRPISAHATHAFIYFPTMSLSVKTVFQRTAHAASLFIQRRRVTFAGSLFYCYVFVQRWEFCFIHSTRGAGNLSPINFCAFIGRSVGKRENKSRDKFWLRRSFVGDSLAFGLIFASYAI